MFHPENLSELLALWPILAVFALIVFVTYSVRLRWRHHRLKAALRRVRQERNELQEAAYRARTSLVSR